MWFPSTCAKKKGKLHLRNKSIALNKWKLIKFLQRPEWAFKLALHTGSWITGLKTLCVNGAPDEIYIETVDGIDVARRLRTLHVASPSEPNLCENKIRSWMKLNSVSKVQSEYTIYWICMFHTTLTRWFIWTVQRKRYRQENQITCQIPRSKPLRVCVQCGLYLSNYIRRSIVSTWYLKANLMDESSHFYRSNESMVRLSFWTPEFCIFEPKPTPIIPNIPEARKVQALRGWSLLGPEPNSDF